MNERTVPVVEQAGALLLEEGWEVLLNALEPPLGGGAGEFT